MYVSDNQYYITEIFQSIQGEGNYVGINSLFIRFHFCNLTCHWCDSKYTWYEKSGKFKNYTQTQLVDLIHKTPVNHIIFTGGEPSLYRLDKLYVEGKQFHVESNGSIIATIPLHLKLKDGTFISRESMQHDIIKNYNWVISPKLKNSHQTINDENILYWVNQSFAIFKFIIKENEDIEEVDYYVKKFNIDKNRIYIGLEGVSLSSQLRYELVDKIIEKGYNYSARLQIILWGNQQKK